MKPMTDVAAMSKMIKAVLAASQRTEKMIVTLSHNLGIFYLFYLGIRSMT